MLFKRIEYHVPDLTAAPASGACVFDTERSGVVVDLVVGIREHFAVVITTLKFKATH